MNPFMFLIKLISCSEELGLLRSALRHRAESLGCVPGCPPRPYHPVCRPVGIICPPRHRPCPPRPCPPRPCYPIYVRPCPPICRPSGPVNKPGYRPCRPCRPCPPRPPRPCQSSSTSESSYSSSSCHSHHRPRKSHRSRRSNITKKTKQPIETDRKQRHTEQSKRIKSSKTNKSSDYRQPTKVSEPTKKHLTQTKNHESQKCIPLPPWFSDSSNSTESVESSTSSDSSESMPFVSAHAKINVEPRFIAPGVVRGSVAVQTVDVEAALMCWRFYIRVYDKDKIALQTQEVDRCSIMNDHSNITIETIVPTSSKFMEFVAVNVNHESDKTHSEMVAIKDLVVPPAPERPSTRPTPLTVEN